MIIRSCKICGKEIKTYPSLNQRFCSVQCRNISHRKRIKTHCLSCNKEFEYRPSHNRKYCSLKCRDSHKEFIERRAKTQFKKGDIRISDKNNYWFGKDLSGANNARYKGENCKRKEQRNDPLYVWWTKQVKKRDKNVCKINNKDCSGYNIVHHILGWTEFPELRYEINNGITLCQAHHPRKRAEEKELQDYFKNLVQVSNAQIC